MNSSPTDNILAFGWGWAVGLYGLVVLDPQTMKGLLLILANFVLPVATRYCYLWMKDHFDKKKDTRRRLAELEDRALAERDRTHSKELQ